MIFILKVIGSLNDEFRKWETGVAGTEKTSDLKIPILRVFLFILCYCRRKMMEKWNGKIILMEMRASLPYNVQLQEVMSPIPIPCIIFALKSILHTCMDSFNFSLFELNLIYLHSAKVICLSISRLSFRLFFHFKLFFLLMKFFVMMINIVLSASWKKKCYHFFFFFRKYSIECEEIVAKKLNYTAFFLVVIS